MKRSISKTKKSTIVTKIVLCLLFVCLLISFFANAYINHSKPLYDLKVAFIGDSITETNYKAFTNWTEYIHHWTGADVQNLGISGTNFHGSKNKISNPYYERISKIRPDTKVIGVAASFNNLDGLSLGKTSDTIESNTICGYINDFFDKLKSEFPDSTILCYCQSQWGTKHLGVKESDEYIISVEEICSNKNIPFNADMYYNDYLSPFDKELYTADNYVDYHFYTNLLRGDSLTDTTHPNSKGHKIIAYHLLNFLLDNIE